jgi:hypothetical protein
MIPKNIIRFLEERANAGFAGTRDAERFPRGHRVPGWLVDADGRVVTALFPESSLPHLTDALLDNGQIALTFEEVGTHETYQLKGRYVAHRPVGPREIDVARRSRDRFIKSLHALYPYEGVSTRLGASIPPPHVAVDVEIQEVFLQTPGPGAGTRLAPPPDAQGSHP